jgi:hypothetical protein
LNQLAYKDFGGLHWETANLKNVLAFTGLRAPHSQDPLSEAILLGIGGGIQPGYSFHPNVLKETGGVFISGRSRMLLPGPEFAEKVLNRLGASPNIYATTGAQGAYHKVISNLKEGRPSIVYLHKTSLPYLHLPKIRGEQVFMHTVVIYGHDEVRDTVLVGDQAPGPLVLAVDDFVAARSATPLYKNRSMTIQVPGKFTEASLRSAVKAGITDYLELSDNPRTRLLSLNGLEEWTHIVGSPKHPQGWRKVYRKGALYRPLVDTYESIELFGGGGGLFRPMYAQFLEEAAVILNRPELVEVAGMVRQLGKEWTDLAEACLPDEVAVLGEARIHLRERHRLFVEEGASAGEEMQRHAERLVEIDQQLAEGEFPLDEEQTDDFLLDLSNRIAGIVLHERKALETLAQIVI